MPCWFYEKEDLETTPSVKDGIDLETEARYRREGSRFIIEAGTAQGLRYDTMATGVVYFHRFYMFHSFKEFPRYVMGAACLFLAGKVEETPKKCKDIIKIAKNILPEQHFNNFGADPKEEIMTHERILLQTIKFDLQVEHPYSYLLKYAKTFKGDKDKIQKLVQMAWTFVNDSLCTTLCLLWEPHIIAVGFLYLAGRLSKSDLMDWSGKQTKVKWWEQLTEDVSLDIMEEICHKLLDLYAAGQKKGAQGTPPKSAASAAAVAAAQKRLKPKSEGEGDHGDPKAKVSKQDHSREKQRPPPPPPPATHATQVPPATHTGHRSSSVPPPPPPGTHSSSHTSAGAPQGQTEQNNQQPPKRKVLLENPPSTHKIVPLAIPQKAPVQAAHVQQQQPKAQPLLQQPAPHGVPQPVPPPPQTHQGPQVGQVPHALQHHVPGAPQAVQHQASGAPHTVQNQAPDATHTSQHQTPGAPQVVQPQAPGTSHIVPHLTQGAVHSVQHQTPGPPHSVQHQAPGAPHTVLHQTPGTPHMVHHQAQGAPQQQPGHPTVQPAPHQAPYQVSHHPPPIQVSQSVSAPVQHGQPPVAPHQQPPQQAPAPGTGPQGQPAAHHYQMPSFDPQKPPATTFSATQFGGTPSYSSAPPPLIPTSQPPPSPQPAHPHAQLTTRPPAPGPSPSQHMPPIYNRPPPSTTQPLQFQRPPPGIPAPPHQLLNTYSYRAPPPPASTIPGPPSSAPNVPQFAPRAPPPLNHVPPPPPSHLPPRPGPIPPRPAQMPPRPVQTPPRPVQIPPGQMPPQVSHSPYQPPPAPSTVPTGTPQFRPQGPPPSQPPPISHPPPSPHPPRPLLQQHIPRPHLQPPRTGGGEVTGMGMPQTAPPPRGMVPNYPPPPTSTIPSAPSNAPSSQPQLPSELHNLDEGMLKIATNYAAQQLQNLGMPRGIAMQQVSGPGNQLPGHQPPAMNTLAPGAPGQQAQGAVHIPGREQGHRPPLHGPSNFR